MGVEDIKRSYSAQIADMIKNKESAERVNAAILDMNDAVRKDQENWNMRSMEATRVIPEKTNLNKTEDGSEIADRHKL